MKLVINKSYGGFDLPEELVEKGYDFKNCARNNKDLIEWVEANIDEKHWDKFFKEYVSKCDFNFTSLRIVEIPDEATDYFINEYDGIEEVIYVLDGKLCWAK